ncbi:MAG: hypothetical protein ACJ73D_07165 [Pyrinomonadaceae bacterium]
MLKITLWIAVAAAIVLASPSIFAQSAKTDKIKADIQKVSVHGDITVIRSDDQWFYGAVEQLDSTSFTIYDIEQKQRVNFSYDQVKKVFKGYGDGAALRRDARGHRIPPSRHRTGLLIGGAVIAAVLIIAVVTLKKD